MYFHTLFLTAIFLSAAFLVVAQPPEVAQPQQPPQPNIILPTPLSQNESLALVSGQTPPPLLPPGNLGGTPGRPSPPPFMPGGPPVPDPLANQGILPSTNLNSPQTGQPQPMTNPLVTPMTGIRQKE
uniref:Uncharacterized protein n=1 Tax=Ditylenchus dipsaci TaxID=166011 RepID=A0A915DGM4_9BILA